MNHVNPAEFCREIEAYLCRKNDGHLIRIVGPVFGTVTGWAQQGIPLKVAFRGIDRYFDRQNAKRPQGAAAGGRRRPVQIQFCEADILDAFDEWRRAVGISASAAAAASASASESASPRDGDGGGVGAESVVHEEAAVSASADVVSRGRKAGLQTHIDRVMARLTQRRVEAGVASAVGATIDRLLAELDTLRDEAKGARNETRARLVATLATLDRTLLDAVIASLDQAAVAALRADARRELEPFQSRMAPDALARAIEAATDRLLRERQRLPIIKADE
jgi:hypothetical protein